MWEPLPRPLKRICPRNYPDSGSLTVDYGMGSWEIYGFSIISLSIPDQNRSRIYVGGATMKTVERKGMLGSNMAGGLMFGRGRSGITAAPRTTSRALRSKRAVALLIVAGGLLGIHGFRLAELQLVQGKYNRQLAEHNRLRPVYMVADRGTILDRHKQVLATSQLTRSLYLYPREQTKDSWKTTAQRLSDVLGLDGQELLAKVEKQGYSSAMPVRIVRDLKPEAFIALAELGQIPGLEVQPESSRQYPNKNIAAHLLGYISEATEEDVKKNPEFPPGMLVGQTGLERLEDARLRGTWGKRLIEVDAGGKELKMLGKQLPVSGQELQTTLDLKLQKAAETALAGRIGAVVVLDVKTGGIMTMASGPTFDPNMFTRRLTQKDVNDVFNNPNKPLLNRAMQGYPPASTFKIVSTAAALQSGKYQPDSTIATAGAINIGGTLFHEHGAGGYGTIGFQEAITVSSNTFFYQVGVKVGPHAIHEWGHKLGVGESLFGLDGGSNGYIPTPETKKEMSPEDWYIGDTVTMAIGQGLVQVTPLEMAVMVATIANGGNRVNPHLLLEQDNQPQFQPENMGFKPTTLDTIKKGLIAVVKEGTARSLSDGTIPPTAGKTGTAEVPGGADNSMYVGYGPVDNPQIAIAVVVEHGGFGAESAVPIAHSVYQAYFGPQKAAVAKP
jgi:penicillin-binding protein 2